MDRRRRVDRGVYDAVLRAPSHWCGSRRCASAGPVCASETASPPVLLVALRTTRPLVNILTFSKAYTNPSRYRIMSAAHSNSTPVPPVTYSHVVHIAPWTQRVPRAEATPQRSGSTDRSVPSRREPLYSI